MLTLIRCPFHTHVTTVARERPRSLCQKCRWQNTPKHAHTLDPTKSEWADYAAQCGNLSGNVLTRNSPTTQRGQQQPVLLVLDVKRGRGARSHRGDQLLRVPGALRVPGSSTVVPGGRCCRTGAGRVFNRMTAK